MTLSHRYDHLQPTFSIPFFLWKVPTPSCSFLKLEIPWPLQWNMMGLEETLLKAKSKCNWRNVINCTNFDPTRLQSSWTTSGSFGVAGGLHYTCTSGFIESKWYILRISNYITQCLMSGEKNQPKYLQLSRPVTCFQL